jgi:hypothetical protein
MKAENVAPLIMSAIPKLFIEMAVTNPLIHPEPASTMKKLITHVYLRYQLNIPRAIENKNT